MSSAYAMPIENGYMIKRFRLDELGHMARSNDMSMVTDHLADVVIRRDRRHRR